MLKTLRRILQEIESEPHLDEALQTLVKRVREAIATETCTLFLFDASTQEYVLLATDGFDPQIIRQIRLKTDEGLVGLIGKRSEPLNLDNAPAHPNFFHSTKTIDEAFHAFLGAPITHRRHVLGVIVVQQREKRRYDEAEEAFLVTVATQLGSIISQSEATSEMNQLLEKSTENTERKDIVFSGIGGTPSIGIGTAVTVYPTANLDAVPQRKTQNIELELTIFLKALQAARSDIRKLRKRVSSLPIEERTVFDAYSHLLDGESLENEICLQIKKGYWAQGALRKVINHHIKQFNAMEDDYLRERAADIRDLGQRILMHLQMEQRVVQTYPEQTILVGETVSAAALAEVPPDKIAGIVSKTGTRSSHVVILARALGIPTVVGIENLPASQLEGQTLIVDGHNEKVYVSPSETLQNHFIYLRHQQQEFRNQLEAEHNLPAKTLDGHSISLLINTGLASDALSHLQLGLEGVGLYRTEIPFMSRDSFPAEEEQYTIYRELLHAFAPRPVIMRTLDIGGDKMLSYFPVEEENPFLGWRGIRITLDHPEIFLIQIRAMLRANIGLNNLQIMLPMITSSQEVDDALKLITQAIDELRSEGLDVKKPLIGIMIEVPAAIYQMDTLIKKIDFVSIGTNDLTQYLLAIDRNNTRVSFLYETLHPAVLRALAHVAEIAHHAGKPVSICGELASEPLAIPLLLAMGFDALSMNSNAITYVKFIIRNIKMRAAKKLLKEILSMENASNIRKRLEEAFQKAGLEKIISHSQF